LLTPDAYKFVGVQFLLKVNKSIILVKAVLTKTMLIKAKLIKTKLIIENFN